MSIVSRFLRRCLSALGVSGDSLVVAECEAFVSGSYLDLLQRSGLPIEIPSWAWVNVLAHGSPADLEKLTDGASRSLHRSTFGWQDCRCAIAAEAIEAARGSETRLRLLQRDVLFPLEQRLRTQPVAAPRAVAQEALSALRAFPDGRSGWDLPGD